MNANLFCTEHGDSAVAAAAANHILTAVILLTVQEPSEL